MSFESLVERVGEVVELVGVAIIVVGLAVSLAMLLLRWRHDGREIAYRDTRRSIGRSILLGLEVLVAGDIIRTVALDPTFTSVAVLGIVVLIRTFLSFTLEVEISGRWPWQAGSHEA
ncbi:MAG: DUF1622 domain-containing protein [Ilumatobacter sp.]|jgi:uncharacterized membrane protein|uniref:DUF1622 domain-containing protein n=1 Tax=Ilumatobacter sp. TaxID=1967498 RepID=UPI00391DD47C